MSGAVMGLILSLRVDRQINKIDAYNPTPRLPVLCSRSRMDPAFYNRIRTSGESKQVIPVTYTS